MELSEQQWQQAYDEMRSKCDQVREEFPDDQYAYQVEIRKAYREFNRKIINGVK